MSKYNRYFGGKAGSAAKAHAAMMAEYGGKKADEVFYGHVNKMKKKGRTILTKAH